jgi:hypothetical protein
MASPSMPQTSTSLSLSLSLSSRRHSLKETKKLKKETNAKPNMELKEKMAPNTERKKAERGKTKKKVCGKKEKNEREIEKEKVGEIKYNCLKSIEGIVIVKFERILFILLNFLLK